MSDPSSHATDLTKLAIHRTIAGRLVLWFLVIALVPCAILTTITSRVAVEAREAAVRDNLIQIAASKAAELENYARERLAAATTLAHDVSIGNATLALAADDPAARAGASTTLTALATTIGYVQFLLIDPSGRITYSLDGAFVVGSSLSDPALSGTDLAARFVRSRTLMQAEMTVFEIYPALAMPIAFVMSPILKDGRVIGVLAGGITPERVWNVLTDMTRLGDTGEIIAAERVGDSMLVTAPLRHSEDAAFRLKLPLRSSADLPVARGARGDRGCGTVTDYRGKEVVGAWCYLPSYRWGMNVKQDASEAFAILNFQRRAIFWLSLATLIAVIVAALVVARSISRPLRIAITAARQVAAGDLRADVGTPSNDETGALLKAIQTMTSDLRGLIGRIQHSSSTLGATATAIQATSEDQQQVVTDFGASTIDAVAAVREITATSHELSRTMTEVNALAASTGTKALDGRQDLEGMDKTMRQLEQSTNSIGEKLATISERASTINVVISTMVKVADQTNLLSINASIEAEKAGDHGLGFLVVAREISRLADQTAIASLDIERTVKEMQGSVSAGVKEMHSFTENVRGGVHEIGAIGGKLGEIISAVQSISQKFGLVNEGMLAQSQGATQIRDAMMRLADGAARTAASLDQSKQATIELRGAVGELKDEVSRFQL